MKDYGSNLYGSTSSFERAARITKTNMATEKRVLKLDGVLTSKKEVRPGPGQYYKNESTLI